MSSESNAPTEMKKEMSKSVRKTLKILKKLYNIVPPLRVLLDGSFVKHLVEKNLGFADIHALFEGVEVEFFVTSCMLEEMRSYADIHSAPSMVVFHQIVSGLTVERCVHEGSLASRDCYGQRLGWDNPEKFFIATVDRTLLEKYSKITAVPMITASGDSLSLKEICKEEKVKAQAHKKRGRFQPAA